jgi:hypothetical protein
VRILRSFRETTGHEHPNWLVGVSNYRITLQKMGLSPEEIERRMHEVTEEASEG